MSSTPPQQQAVCTCDECGATKKTTTREVSFSSTSGESKGKHHQGSVDWGDYAGETDRKNMETRSNGTTTTRTENFFVCPTPGCVQRKRDRWSAKRWELKNNPNLDDSLEMQDREIERIDEEEERHYRQTRRYSDKGHTSKWREIEGKGKKHREPEKQRYREGMNRIEENSSRQSVRDTMRQSDNRSRDTSAQSRQSDQQTTANGWGAADADRSSTRSGEHRDAFRAAVDTRANQTTNGNEAFADNVYDDEAATATGRDDFRDAIDPEELDAEKLDKEDTETYNHSRSRKHH